MSDNVNMSIRTNPSGLQHLPTYIKIINSYAIKRKAHALLSRQEANNAIVWNDYIRTDLNFYKYPDGNAHCRNSGRR